MASLVTIYRVPLSESSVDECPEGRQGGGAFTTMIFRNVPRKFTSMDLVEELEFYMDRRDIDFAYAPWVRQGNSNMGYAFVNFRGPLLAARAYALMEGREWRKGHRSRLVELQPARVQGLSANLERYMEREEPEEGHCPLLFSDGIEISLKDALSRHAAEKAASQRMRQMFVYGSSCSQGTSTAEGEECGSCCQVDVVGQHDLWQHRRLEALAPHFGDRSASAPWTRCGSKSG